jgi:hypothetical protein
MIGSITGRTSLSKLFCCLSLIAIAGTSCDSLDLSYRKSDPAAERGEAVYHLDSTKTSVAQPIEPRDKVEEGNKFVQVEVTEVVNPKRYAISFAVDYQLKSGTKMHLGDFGPYPADNTGTFIVPTQGKLKNEGAIVLSLVIPDKVEPGDALKVTVKRMKILKE